MSSWQKVNGIAEHIGLSIKTTRRLIAEGTIPVTRLPSGRIIGNLDAIDRALLDLGDTRRQEESQQLDRILENIM